AGLLRMDATVVDVARAGERVTYGGLRELGEGGAARALALELRRLRDVPRDRLALTVGVGRQEHRRRLRRVAAEVGQELFRLRDDRVGELHAAVDLDAEAGLGRFRQIADVTHRGPDFVV